MRSAAPARVRQAGAVRHSCSSPVVHRHHPLPVLGQSRLQYRLEILRTTLKITVRPQRPGPLCSLPERGHLSNETPSQRCSSPSRPGVSETSQRTLVMVVKMVLDDRVRIVVRMAPVHPKVTRSPIPVRGVQRSIGFTVGVSDGGAHQIEQAVGPDCRQPVDCVKLLVWSQKFQHCVSIRPTGLNGMRRLHKIAECLPRDLFGGGIHRRPRNPTFRPGTLSADGRVAYSDGAIGSIRSVPTRIRCERM